MSATVTSQIAALMRQFGPSLQACAHLPHVDFEPVCLADRWGEVCMVIRRPDGAILTALKMVYPSDAHRLLTGGIHPGESVLAALEREVAEETGLTVAVRRLLAVVAYHADTTAPPIFWTFAFLIDELGGDLVCSDPTEQHAAFHQVRAADLWQRAQTLASIDPYHHSALRHNWAAWGRFRAIIHRVVWSALRDLP